MLIPYLILIIVLTVSEDLLLEDEKLTLLIASRLKLPLPLSFFTLATSHGDKEKKLLKINFEGEERSTSESPNLAKFRDFLVAPGPLILLDMVPKKSLVSDHYNSDGRQK